MTEFTIKLAGIPVLVRCRQEGNRAFFREYLTQESPRFTLEPGEEDLALTRQQLHRQAALDGTPDGPYSPFFLENCAIHWMLANELAIRNVLLMHGSAIVVDGECYIFTAPSGTGKSTHTRLWRQQFGDRAYMLNDDKPMLAVGEEGVTAYGTPWAGKHRLSRNASAPLIAVVQLERDRVNHLEPISSLQALPVLHSQALRPYTAAAMEQVLRLERQILKTVPFYHLGCNMDPEAALVAYRGIKKGTEV